MGGDAKSEGWIDGAPVVCGAYFVRRHYKGGTVVEYVEINQGTGDAQYRNMSWRDEPPLLSEVAPTITHHVPVVPPRLAADDHVLPLLSCDGAVLRSDGLRPGVDVPHEHLHRRAVDRAIGTGDEEFASARNALVDVRGGGPVTVRMPTAEEAERQTLLKSALYALREYRERRWGRTW